MLLCVLVSGFGLSIRRTVGQDMGLLLPFFVCAAFLLFCSSSELWFVWSWYVDRARAKEQGYVVCSFQTYSLLLFYFACSTNTFCTHWFEQLQSNKKLTVDKSFAWFLPHLVLITCLFVILRIYIWRSNETNTTSAHVLVLVFYVEKERKLQHVAALSDHSLLFLFDRLITKSTQ